MKFKSITDLTPLIDVFLILVFVLLIGNNQKLQETAMRANQLNDRIDSLQQIALVQKELNEAFQQDLSASEDSIIKYRQALEIQQQTLQNTIVSISGKLSELFNETTLDLQQKVLDNRLSMEDYDTFTQKLEDLKLTEQEGLIEKIYILSELQSIATTITIYLDSGNVISIADELQPIALNKFDENTGDFDMDAQEQFSQKLSNALESYYDNLRRSEQKPGELVLITFGYSEQAMRGAISITEDITKSFYQNLILRENRSKKVFYAPLGFYPKSQS